MEPLTPASASRNASSQSIATDLDAQGATRLKTIYLIRHGQTEMNVWLQKHYSGLVSVEDPLLYDTRLTPEGQKQALKLAGRLETVLKPPPELLVVSPLTRALQTATLAFEDPALPRVILPLAAERVWHSSDVGRSPAELAAEYGPEYDFSGLPDIWWFNGKSTDAKRVVLEPDTVFFARMERLRQWILDRPESTIAVVCHWGVINALTGKDPNNCEVTKTTSAERDFYVRKLSAF